VDWLTDPFALDILQRTLIAGLLTALAGAVVGTWVVIRGLTFMGDALAHGVLPGIAVAVLLDINPVLGAAASALIMVVGVRLVADRSRLPEDVGIGLLFVGMLALAVVIISRSATFATDLTGALFGDVLGVTTGESSWVRLQQPLQPFIVMWVALGAGWAVGRLNRGHTFAAIILGGVLVGVCLGRVPQIQKIANPQMEYAFLREQAPLIDPDCSVVIADRFMAERKISTEYPMWWSRAQVVEMTPFMESVSGRRSCAVFYLGLSCWMFGERETPGQDGMRPECKRLEQEYWLTPIAEWIQPSRPYTAFSVPSARITFGFYRLKPKGSPAEAPLRPPVEILEQLPR
jgi:hypothetical protein